MEKSYTTGGLGSAVSEILVKNKPVSIDFVGINDCFTESGLYDELMAKYGISVPAIVAKAEVFAAGK